MAYPTIEPLYHGVQGFQIESILYVQLMRGKSLSHILSRSKLADGSGIPENTPFLMAISL